MQTQQENPHGSFNSTTTGSSSSSMNNNYSANSLTLGGMLADIKDKFKAEDDGGFGGSSSSINPYLALDKAFLLQESRKNFGDANVILKNPRKCCQLITQLLFLLTSTCDTPLTSAETSEVFFGVTKLFQSRDGNLRRMMYLFIKEVAEATAADEVIIVTQSLTKDMNSDVDLYRANSIRVLCRIIDSSMLSAIERYIKQAIVDKNSLVASSALVSGIHLVKNNPEVIRRWVNEVQEAMNSKVEMVQYHAVSLLYEIKQHDKLAVSKFVTQLQRQNLSSPLALCLLIRYTAKILREDMLSPNAQPFYKFLESMLRNKSDMVTYEAAKSICALPVEARDLSPAINVLQTFLSSPIPTLRFAAVRTLSHVAMTQPMIVTKCNDDMEALISDSNRSIATLAITTLLKTGAESSVDRLMKQISAFMGDIADEFKIVVVEAIQSLCCKYPPKHRVLMNFLSNFLREEGGFEFKQTVTNTLIYLIERIPESKDIGLLHLSEFIEDCEFSALSVKVLHFLGQKGPSSTTPSRFIRFIYNRVILENAAVRASAVSALAQFAIKVKKLRKSILVLLQQCVMDDDDEVRDRAILYIRIIEEASPEVQKRMFLDELPMTGLALQRSLEQYKLRPADGPISFDKLPFVEISKSEMLPKMKEHGGDNVTQDDLMSGVTTTTATSVASTPEDTARELYKIKEFANLGPLFRSSSRIELTEAETEYVVTCIKHSFAKHVVLEFEVLNTVKEQLLRNISVGFELSEEESWSIHSSIPLQNAVYGEKGSCFLCLEHNSEDTGYSPVTLQLELKFKLFELDPTTGEPDEEGFDEEYPLEEMEVSAVDFMAKVQVPDFRSAWEQIGDEAEVREQYALPVKSIADGVKSVLNALGMHPCDNTATSKARAKAHILLMSGVFIGGIKVLVKSKLSLDEANGIILQMAVRSEDPTISQIVSDCIQ